MQPVTISRRQAPVFLCSAISRMVSIDSCLALSMNAQVLTTSTSASAASRVSWCPCCWASPSITSESTRFLGQPSETIPIFIRWALDGDRASRIRTSAHGSMLAPRDHATIADISASQGTDAVGSRVTVRGWVRTRRDSKAGLSFIHLHDGSCFDPIQVVAPARCPTTRARSRS